MQSFWIFVFYTCCKLVCAPLHTHTHTHSHARAHALCRWERVAQNQELAHAPLATRGSGRREGAKGALHATAPAASAATTRQPPLLDSKPRVVPSTAGLLPPGSSTARGPPQDHPQHGAVGLLLAGSTAGVAGSGGGPGRGAGTSRLRHASSRAQGDLLWRSAPQPLWHHRDS